MSPDPVILVVDDEAPIRRFISAGLAAHGFAPVEAGTATGAVLAATSRRPEAILLDLGLPDRDGLVLLKELRAWYDRPILILSARGQEEDKVAGLDAGADDYIAKPFGMPELLARLRAALRRSPEASSADPIFMCGSLIMDLAARSCRSGARDIQLTPLEFSLLAELMRNRGRLVTHRQLIHAGWGTEVGVEAGNLRLIVHQIRKKIEGTDGALRQLQTEVGIGYRLVCDGSAGR